MFSLRKPLQTAIGALLVALAATAPAQTGKESITAQLIKQMGIEQQLGAMVPGDVTFRDESGKAVKFGDYYGGRPLLVLPIYFRCTSGCALITDGLLKTLADGTKHNRLVVGRDLDVVMLGIDPQETPEIAAKKKGLITKAFAQPNTVNHWHLLTGSMANIRRVTNAMGVHYGFNEQYDLVDHPTCSVTLTPTGKISSYTIGNSFPAKAFDANLALAANNQVGAMADQSRMFGCIVIDPITEKSSMWVTHLMRFGGLLTLLILIASIVKMSLPPKKPLANGGMTPGA